jgi:DNA modification methylase
MARRPAANIEPAAPAWRNRIVGHGEVAASSLAANPKNWRVHPKAQQAALDGVLREVGWVQNVIVNQRTGFVVDGHARVAMAVQRGEQVPVVYVDLSEEEEALVLATLDPLSAMATTDEAMLASLKAGMTEAHQALAAATADELVGGWSKAEPEAQVDRAEELLGKWKVERGYVWQIGAHRLMCGDSTVRGDVEELMQGEHAEMVWTDPPYGVAIGDKNVFLNSIARSNRVEENLANDTLDEDGLRSMLQVAFANIARVCTPGAAWYVAAPAGPPHLIFGGVLNGLGIWRQTIQWVKNNATFSPMGVDYHWQAEPIFYGWLPNAGHRYRGDRTQTTVWNIDRPSKSPEHPTMKPLDLVARALMNSSDADQVVVDGFLGSGSTMCAAENTGRRCYGMEIEPKYCAVILERMTAMGLTPELVHQEGCA